MLAQGGVTIEQVCTCTIDRYMRSATVAQIREDSANPMPARISAASAQCVTELVAAAQAHAVAPANGAAPAAPEAGAAEEPAEAGGEVANEAH